MVVCLAQCVTHRSPNAIWDRLQSLATNGSPNWQGLNSYFVIIQKYLQLPSYSSAQSKLYTLHKMIRWLQTKMLNILSHKKNYSPYVKLNFNQKSKIFVFQYTTLDKAIISLERKKTMSYDLAEIETFIF